MSKFTPSPDEVALVNRIFAQVDTQRIGVITGEAAVKIFSGTKLPASTLAEVWNIADEDNNGVLTRKGVAIAIRLLGHAQRGDHVAEALIHKQGPPPSIEGLNAPISQPLSQQNTGLRSTKSPPPGFPPLTPQDKTKFMNLFAGCGPVNGLLNGEKARDVLVKSKLPVDKLSQIWSLADQKGRGALDVSDFTIAMYLVQASMSGQLQTIPPTLPSYIHEQAGSSPVISHPTGDIGGLSPNKTGSFNGRPVSTIQPNYTGSLPLQPQITGPGLRPHVTGGPPALPARSGLGNTLNVHQATLPWDVTTEEKARSDRIFDTLDSAKRGYLEGDVAVQSLRQSNLSDDILAKVWDLADLNHDGHLTKEGFAVAIHLIQHKLTGREIPAVLPTSLIPPSKRANGASAAPSPPQPAIPEAMRDLLWDDAPPPSNISHQAPVVPVRSQATGSLSPQHTAAASPKANIFAPSDPFAGPHFGGAHAAHTAHRDLLLDDDDEVPASSPPLQDRSAEIGNVQNQLNSTSQSFENTKAERANVERQLAEQATQLSSLQTQLSSAKAAYETETRLLGTLRERFATQSADIRKAREELIHAESDLSALRVEKAELEGSVLRDKEEIRGLQRKMAEASMSVETCKGEIEKAKKEAKQQKGLLAIAKKQLATKEAERAKIEKELEEAQAEVQSVQQELEETESELARSPTPVFAPPQPNGYDIPKATSPDLGFAAAQPLPVSPEMTGSPTPSVVSRSTNPFERLTMAPNSSPAPPSQSPFLPFANSSAVPTPSLPDVVEQPAQPTEVNTNPDDPFGFSEAFGEPQPQPVVTSPIDQPPSTPFDAHTADPSDVLSPTSTELFATPLTSATVTRSQEDPAAVAAAHFPALDAVSTDFVASPQVPGHFPLDDWATTSNDGHTGLDAQLKEIEQEESDTDSDDDDEPLQSVKAKLSEKPELAPTIQDTALPPDASTSSAFDDSFGIGTSSSAATIRSGTPHQPTPIRSQSPALSSHSSAKDAFGLPFAAPKIEPVQAELDTSVTAPPADVTAFDEALGKAPSGGAAPSQFSQFTFESSFDPTFDFGASFAATSDQAAPSSNGTLGSAFTSGSSSTPARSATGDSFDAVFLPSGGPSAPSNGPAASDITSRQESHSVSFDDAFRIPNQPQLQLPTQTSPALIPTNASNGSMGISFDDAFGGVSASEALALNDSFTAPTPVPAPAPAPAPTLQQQPFQPPPGPPPAQAQTPAVTHQTPFPATSPPVSPARESTSSSHHGRPISPPPRSISPSPRKSSPKQRPGTANSVDEEKPARRSKLSIRLPFGRKKKTGAAADIPPVPTPLAHPHTVVEDPTPAADDDIEAVKQLCSMGFSRTQAVDALEKYGYDVPRALNSLLGS